MHRCGCLGVGTSGLTESQYIPKQLRSMAKRFKCLWVHHGVPLLSELTCRSPAVVVHTVVSCITVGAQVWALEV
jgi:hypothetical protein